MLRQRHITTVALMISCLSLPAFAQSDTDAVKDTAAGYIVDKAQSFISDFADSLKSDRIKVLEIDITEDNSQLGGEAKAVIGITETDRRFTFSQLSVIRRNKRTTANIGLGHRYITTDDTAVIGANIFADQETDAGHRRVSVGLEYLTLRGSLHLNHYMRQSKTKDYKGVQEKAMDGTDLKLAYRFDVPYQPHISVRGFQWKGDGGYKASGQEIGVGVQLSEGVQLSAFHKDDNKNKADTRAMLRYSHYFGADDSTTSENTGQSADAMALRRLLYQPVERENTIRKTQVKLGVIVTAD